MPITLFLNWSATLLLDTLSYIYCTLRDKVIPMRKNAAKIQNVKRFRRNYFKKLFVIQEKLYETFLTVENLKNVFWVRNLADLFSVFYTFCTGSNVQGASYSDFNPRRSFWCPSIWLGPETGFTILKPCGNFLGQVSFTVNDRILQQVRSCYDSTKKLTSVLFTDTNTPHYSLSLVTFHLQN